MADHPVTLEIANTLPLVIAQLVQGYCDCDVDLGWLVSVKCLITQLRRQFAISYITTIYNLGVDRDPIDCHACQPPDLFAVNPKRSKGTILIIHSDFHGKRRETGLCGPCAAAIQPHIPFTPVSQPAKPSTSPTRARRPVAKLARVKQSTPKLSTPHPVVQSQFSVTSPPQTSQPQMDQQLSTRQVLVEPNQAHDFLAFLAVFALGCVVGFAAGLFSRDAK